MNSRHKILAFFLPAALLLALPVIAQPTTWEIDRSHSSIDFAVRHFFTPVPGNFRDFDGVIVYDAEKPEASTVEFTVQATSIDTGNDRRDEHLRSPDFFNVAEHPTLSFKSSSVKPGADGKLMVTGDLTMHGVTKTVTIPVEVLGMMGDKAGFATEFTIDRKDYGITWNRALDSGGAILGEDVEIEINVEATKAKPAMEEEAAE